MVGGMCYHERFPAVLESRVCGRCFACEVSWEDLCPHGPWLLVAVKTYPYVVMK